MNYQKENPMAEVNTVLQRFKEFFISLENSSLQLTGDENQAWEGQDFELHNILIKTQTKVDEALKDNFDTPTAMQTLLDLVTSTNSYISTHHTKIFLLKKIGSFVTKILKVFGIINNDLIGFPSKTSESGNNKKEILVPFLNNFTVFRTEVRSLAKKNSPPKEYLDLCDDFRDNKMPDLGIRISDDGTFPYSFVDRDELLKEKKDKLKEDLLKELTSLKSTKNNKKTRIENARQATLPIAIYIRQNGLEVNDEGILIEEIDAEGKKIPIKKSQQKKLTKVLKTYNNQKKKIRRRYSK